MKIATREKLAKMKELIIPKKLNAGDTVAFISISGGRAGDPDMLPRYKTGKKRFEEIFGVKVIETPNALNGSKLAGLHEIRAFAAAGAFDKAKAVLTGPLDDDSKEMLLQVIDNEVRRKDMIILENVDFIHRTPMTVLPVGARIEVDCDKPSIRILDSGVL